MRGVLISLTILLLPAAWARADTISASYTGPVAITATVDNTTSPTYDIITVLIAAISGNPSSTDKVTMLDGGQWDTPTAGAGYYLSGSDSNWESRTYSTYQDNYPTLTSTTCFGFNTDTGALYDGATLAFRTLSSGSVYSAFGDTWYSNKTSAYLPVGSALAVLWVTKPGAGLSETFKFENYNAGNGSRITTKTLIGNAETLTLTLTGLVPEPGTFVLLAAGLAGFLCYAWRKRRQ